VAELTVSELSEMNVGSWFNAAHPKRAVSAYETETVPSLERALGQLSDFRGLIYIELKCKDSEIERLSQAVCNAILDSPLLPQIIIKSFKLGVIPQVRFGCPPVNTAALFAPKIMRYLRKEKHLVKIAEEFGVGHVSLHYSLVSKKLMRRIEKTGIKVTIWTANKPLWVHRAANLGLFAVITNDPARLIEAQRGRRNPSLINETA
jgi:glycerophosphoryl diester phosphodiesterase